MSDLYWMNQAYQLALAAKKQGEVPVGAVLVDEHNQRLGQGKNALLQQHDPSAHAEILALREAGKNLANYRLLNTTLYVTLEPCPMCASALVQARVKRVVFATRDLKAGAAGTVFNLLRGYPLNHQVQVDEGLMQAECAQLLSQFFDEKR